MLQKLIIGVSRLAPNYENWLKYLADSTEIIDLYQKGNEDALKLAESVHGILLTGGCDVHPAVYDEPDFLEFCQNVDERRDKLELGLVRIALEKKIPLFGICRGEQILNVALKGSLCADIPSEFPCAEKHAGHAGDSWHNVMISRDSMLYEITGLISGHVNSSHHQCINRVARGLRVTARSSDEIIEAVEADNTIDHPFCIAVQWHPERMDYDSPLSEIPGKAFIKASENYKNGVTC